MKVPRAEREERCVSSIIMATARPVTSFMRQDVGVVSGACGGGLLLGTRLCPTLDAGMSRC